MAVPEPGAQLIPQLDRRVAWSRVYTVAAPVGALLIAIAVVGWGLMAAAPTARRLAGMDDMSSPALPQMLTIALSSAGQTFTPQVAAVIHGSRVRFTNALATPVEVHTTVLDPAQFSVLLPAHGQAEIRLDHLGLYQYYDALSASPRHIVAGNMVLRARSGSAPPRQGWIAVVGDVSSLQEQLTVPTGQDLFSPKVLVAVVGSTIVVTNHDNEAHNFVVDPASPAGAAFVVAGSDTEGPTGWRRVLVVQQAGLYHVYCTLHTRVIGRRDGWALIAPAMKASGLADDNPMEAWIIVLPATADV